jgi:thiol-disulfide isomerase/thioredoxin
MEDISIRLFIIAFILTSVIFVKIMSKINKRNLTKSKKLNRDLLPSWQPGKQAIVYFTNDSCHECEKLQKPALNLLEATDTQIFTINASLDKTLASYYKILTVPTTIILDNYGEAQFMNHGYTNEKILSAQLEQV